MNLTTNPLHNAGWLAGAEAKVQWNLNYLQIKGVVAPEACYASPDRMMRFKIDWPCAGWNTATLL